ncbi:response regulator [Brevibacillus laterosporus]|uniref:Transcriptional regulatory protein n=1 Tax=Brevibacillus laterosporus LMG 15441 TaxID=1042163 RepID=A0A075R4F6_BRELA|nr:response regulator [Brevibacillus laterosporus]AIG26351.1 transcriptional regulatory protein CitT [Brevibacillus laterosporus LMG 15441]RJL08365.1 response regulator [Brevibacillus laterosporus]TPH13514.1 response regulator [Brevibacillus laterosporus]
MFRVVIIEDDPMVQELHRLFIQQVEGFTVIGVASNGLEGLSMIQELQPDLAIMDIFMPSQNGIETLKQLRSGDNPVEIIVITAAKDMETIQTMMRHGAFDYIMKPFKFERIKQALDNFSKYAKQTGEHATMSQSELDSLLFGQPAKQERQQQELPKGLHSITMHQIKQFMVEQKQSMSAEEVAEHVGLARVTARRYLEYLERTQMVERDVQYGGVGRPVNRYLIKK